MRRVSARREPRADDLLYAAAGLGLGLVLGFVTRTLVGDLSRRRVRQIISDFSGPHPAPITVRSTATRIETALTGEPALGDLEFEIIPVRAGQVELHGWAPSRTAAARALRVAAAAAPGTDVTNRLRIRGEDEPHGMVPAQDLRPA